MDGREWPEPHRQLCLGCLPPGEVLLSLSLWAWRIDHTRCQEPGAEAAAESWEPLTVREPREEVQAREPPPLTGLWGVSWGDNPPEPSQPWANGIALSEPWFPHL